MSEISTEWHLVKCGNIEFYVDFDFHEHFQHKRKTGRFDFHQSLFKFLDEENRNFEEGGKYTLHLSLERCTEEPYFNFDETGQKFVVNYPCFKESCEKSKRSNQNYARIFFGKDISMRAVSAYQNKEETDKFILEHLDEDMVVNWWNKLTDNEKSAFLGKIKSGFSVADLSNNDLIQALRGRDLTIEDIQNLNYGFEIKKLEEALEIWEENKENSDEDFWQKTFTEKNWILSQIFSCPVVFIKGRPYCGGKSPNDKGGVYSDFRFSNEIVESSIFIEIKTPKTGIVGSKYRGESEENQEDQNLTYSMNAELSGGITQAINQRQTAIENFGKDLQVRNSKCILLIGMAQILKPAEKKSFDLFRNSNKDVEIITFDELFKRIENLLNLLRKDQQDEPAKMA